VTDSAIASGRRVGSIVGRGIPRRYSRAPSSISSVILANADDNAPFQRVRSGIGDHRDYVALANWHADELRLTCGHPSIGRRGHG